MPSAAAVTGNLEARLRRASSAAGMRTLLRALGIRGALGPLAAAELRAAGLGALGARAVSRLHGAGPLAWLVSLARPLGPGDLRALARALPGEPPALLLAAPPGSPVLLLACLTAGGELRVAAIDRLAPRAGDLRLLEELRGSADGPALATALRWAQALDRATIGARFFRELRVQRDAVARAWRGLPARRRGEREQLALLLLCRLLFLYFLQQRGHLLGDRAFLVNLLRGRRRAAGDVPLYVRVITPLFFACLNTRPEARTAAARALGALPYLNGGLFEPHALERRYPDLRLPDDVLLRTFSDFLERYRYASRDAAEGEEGAEASLDPEVLGRAFEALMQPARRDATGTFYTPPKVVDALVSRALAVHLEHAARLGTVSAHALIHGQPQQLTAEERTRARAALRTVRVLDPACGSGAFLLGMLVRITRARALLHPGASEAALRQQAVADALHGVDLLDDAALLCSLRLWLALAPASGEPVPPLPNLDRRIRQGDALIDPLDLLTPGAARGADRGAALDGAVRHAIHALVPLGRRYLTAEPAERAVLHARLHHAEAALARVWLEALQARLRDALRSRRAAAGDRDLWGDAAPHALRAAREASRLQQRLEETERLLGSLEDAAALPFFSFLVHFAAEKSGFDVIVSNPPWVRAHRWPAALAGAVRERYHVCRSAGPARAGAGQVDLALLFLERALGLLADNGVLAMLLPAKLLRSLYAAGARELLLRQAAVLEIEDHALDQRAIFRADAFTVSLLARRTAPAATPRSTAVRVTLQRRGAAPLSFTAAAAELPLVPGDPRSPWLLAPPEVVTALRTMQRRGTPLQRVPEATIRRGVVTGANDVLVAVAHEHRLGGLARIHGQGWARHRRRGAIRDAAAFTAWVESSALRPLVRGTDVRAWRWQAPQRILWVPANDRAGAIPPPRLERYLSRHRAVLERRTGSGARGPAGTLLRLSPDTLGHKVVWQDIASDLHAVAVPARVPEAGSAVPVIPLNSVYFSAVASADDALLLAAYLNSLPLRVFARAIAERAKDAHFRFFAWTVGALPLPRDWRTAPRADSLRALSREAHAREGIEPAAQVELDRLVAEAFGLEQGALAALAGFDAWLRGNGR